MKGDQTEDPRGLIYEAYRIEGISEPECRTIFLDWALGVPAGQDMVAMIRSLLDVYGPANDGHPMTLVLREGLQRSSQTPKRRGGRAARQAG